MWIRDRSIPVFGDIAIILNAPISAILAKRKKMSMTQVAPFVNLGLTLTHGLVQKYGLSFACAGFVHTRSF